MYDRIYPITIVMPNNGEKENNISKNQLICDIVNNTHKFPFRVFEEHYIYFRKPCMSNAIIPSIFTERVRISLSSRRIEKAFILTDHSFGWL